MNTSFTRANSGPTQSSDANFLFEPEYLSYTTFQPIRLPKSSGCTTPLIDSPGDEDIKSARSKANQSALRNCACSSLFLTTVILACLCLYLGTLKQPALDRQFSSNCDMAHFIDEWETNGTISMIPAECSYGGHNVSTTSFEKHSSSLRARNSVHLKPKCSKNKDCDWGERCNGGFCRTGCDDDNDCYGKQYCFIHDNRCLIRHGRTCHEEQHLCFKDSQCCSRICRWQGSIFPTCQRGSRTGKKAEEAQAEPS